MSNKMKELKVSTKIFEHWNRVVTQQELYDVDEEYILEMCNVSKQHTGLPYDLWIDTLGSRRGNEHSNSPRIKVRVDDTWIPLSVSDNPDIPQSVRSTGVKDYPGLSIVKKYVKAYKKILLAHYYSQISDREALNLLRTIKDCRKAELELSDLLDITKNFSIQYHWDTDWSLYEINVVDEDSSLVTTSYASTDYELLVELGELQRKYQVENIHKVT